MSEDAYLWKTWIGPEGPKAVADKAVRLDEYTKFLEGPAGTGLTDYQRQELLRKHNKYETEVEGKSYEELVSIYKDAFKDTPDGRASNSSDPRWVDKQDLKSNPSLDTPEELKAEAIKVMQWRDWGHVRTQTEEEIDRENQLGIDPEAPEDVRYDQLADHYKNLYRLNHQDEFPNEGDFERWKEQTDLKSDKDLNTYNELLQAARGQLMTLVDHSVQAERKAREHVSEEDIEMTSGSGEPAGAGDQWPEWYRDFREKYSGEQADAENQWKQWFPPEQEEKAPPPVDQPDASSANQRPQGFSDSLREQAGAATTQEEGRSIWEQAKAVKDQAIAEAREQAGADAVAPAYSPKDMAADVGAAADAGAPADAGAGADEDQRPQGFSDSSSDASSATERVEPLLGFEAAPKAAAQLPRDEDRDLTGGDPEEVSSTVDKEPVNVPDASGAAVSGVAVGAVGEAGGPGELIEEDATGDAAGEAVLVDPPEEPTEDQSFGTLEEPGAEDETSSNVFPWEGDEDTTARIPDITTTTGSPSEPLEPLGAPGETIEDAADATGEAILIDPPGAAGDGVEDMDESAATPAVLEDGVEPPPFMEDTLEGGGGLGGDDFGGNEDVVEHMDDPVF